MTQDGLSTTSCPHVVWVLWQCNVYKAALNWLFYKQQLTQSYYCNQKSFWISSTVCVCNFEVKTSVVLQFYFIKALNSQSLKIYHLTWLTLSQVKPLNFLMFFLISFAWKKKMKKFLCHKRFLWQAHKNKQNSVIYWSPVVGRITEVVGSNG